MLKIIENGNIFDSKCETLVNPVNCAGVMGKGLALEFKKRYPGMYLWYKDACLHNQIRIGECLIRYYADKSIMCFPTKYDWRDPSHIKWIEAGLNSFLKEYKNFGIKSIAFPMLGCGCGGLKKKDVLPLMLEKLKDLDIDVEIYI